ncbi:thioredoxin family protein [Polaribacter gangjinensis]|uniref:Thioredoxin family protein n=1 Tax=Polaribacter gangjinensis TaxID=574710 RepID=A0A2S7WFB9_9FLAO|nr:thioredoxin family protein [Polaribacter gangjinensis]PQJ75981.1 thioredoxin family protein [Polaribacter gangjinensis]
MARTESNEFELGRKAPEFRLLNTIDDIWVDLESLKGKNGTVVVFICNHCPFVIHINEKLVQLANDYQSKGIRFIAISSNDIEKYPQDAPHLMKKLALELNFTFPYLFDETQMVAKAYNAACTPDFYLFDADLKAVYHGQFDDSRPGNNIPVSGNDLQKAMEHLLHKKPILENQKPSIGCGIKWK